MKLYSYATTPASKIWKKDILCKMSQVDNTCFYININFL